MGLDKYGCVANWNCCEKHLLVKAVDLLPLPDSWEVRSGLPALKSLCVFSFMTSRVYQIPSALMCSDVFALAWGARRPPAILGARQTLRLQRWVHICTVALAMRAAESHLSWLRKIRLSTVMMMTRQRMMLARTTNAFQSHTCDVNISSFDPDYSLSSNDKVSGEYELKVLT